MLIRHRRSTYLYHTLGEVRQLSNVDTETLIAYTWLDLVQQGDIAIAAAFLGVRNVRDDMKVFDMIYFLVQCGQLVEVGREHAERMYLGCDMPEESIVKTRIRTANVQHTLR